MVVNNIDFLEITNISALEPLKLSKKFLDYFAVFNALKAVNINLRLNIMNCQIELNGHSENIIKLGDNPIQALSNAIRWLLQKMEYKYPASTEITEILTLIADQNQFHPVREILENNTWDGLDRFPKLCEIMGLTDPKKQSLLKKWLIQSVAMLYNDKNQALQAEGVLVLQGVEGIGIVIQLKNIENNNI